MLTTDQPSTPITIENAAKLLGLMIVCALTIICIPIIALNGGMNEIDTSVLGLAASIFVIRWYLKHVMPLTVKGVAGMIGHTTRAKRIEFRAQKISMAGD